MAFVFCGSSIPKEVGSNGEYTRQSTVSPATLERESYLLDAIKQSKYDKIFFVTSALSNNKNITRTQLISIGRVTYVLLGSNGANRYTRFASLARSFFQWALDALKPNDVICVYNFSLIFAITILSIRPFRSFKLMIDMEDRFNRSDYRYYINYIFEYLGIRSADYFLASSPVMSRYLKSKNSNAQSHVNGGYIVKSKINTSEKKISDLVRICYFGSLDGERGVLDLIHSFSANKDSRYRLIITGSGVLEGVIKAYAIKDKRIQFLGLLDDEKFKDVLLNADICVNSQTKDISINFPSKVTMYLSYGKLVLSTEHSALFHKDYSGFIKFYDQSKGDFWDCLYDLNEGSEVTAEAEESRKSKFHSMSALRTKSLVDYLNLTSSI